MIEAERVEGFQTWNVMQCLGYANCDKSGDNVGYEMLCKTVCGFEEPAYENQVEQAENQKHHSQKEGIGIHKGVAPIYLRIRKNGHSDQRKHGHNCKAAEFNEDCKQEFAFYNIAFRHRQQGRKNNVVGLPCILIALKDSESDKERAAENRIARQQSHKAEGNEEIGKK